MRQYAPDALAFVKRGPAQWKRMVRSNDKKRGRHIVQEYSIRVNTIVVCEILFFTARSLSPFALERRSRILRFALKARFVLFRNVASSSSGLGHQVLILETGVRFPVGLPSTSRTHARSKRAFRRRRKSAFSGAWLTRIPEHGEWFRVPKTRHAPVSFPPRQGTPLFCILRCIFINPYLKR